MPGSLHDRTAPAPMTLPPPVAVEAASSHRGGVLGIAALAAAGALAAELHPSASPVADVVVTVAISLLVVDAASRARPPAWLAATALTAMAAARPWLAVALAGLALAAVVARSPRSQGPIIGAAIGALVLQVLVRMPTERTSLNLLAAGGVAGILAVSAHRTLGPVARRRRRVVVTIAGASAGIACLGLLVSVAVARQQVQRGIDRADDGLAAARVGKGTEAADLLDGAARSFAAAHDDLDAWWTAPARWVPGVGPHARALEVLTEEGARLAAASATAARAAGLDDLQVTDGDLDLDQVRAVGAPLTEVRAALADASVGVARAESPWLVGPVSERIAGFTEDIDAAREEAATAAQAIEVLPDLLGGSGERRYFVAFGTPSETRDLGGFMGAYAILQARDGELSLRSTGRVRNLNLYFLRGQLTDPTVFPDHYLALLPQKFWQNVTGSPDFPTVAEAIRQLWKPPAAPLDGVLYLDPQALATMLELTGPIRLEGYDTPLTAATAADFLERDQYIEFPDDDRHDFLVDAASTVFERLTAGELPAPSELADTLSPAVRQRRLLFNSFRPAEQALFERLDLDGSLPPVAGDFLSVRASNRGRSKIDAFMQRTITYAVRADPATGAVRSTVTVEVRNDAPASGLPDPVIGNRLDRPTGTSSTTVSVYTPLGLVDVQMGGESINRGTYEEYGRNRFSALVDIPPGGSRTVVFELEGSMDLRNGYHLDVVPQPLVHPDQLVFELTGPSGWALIGRSSVAGALEEDEAIDVSFFSFGRD